MVFTSREKWMIIQDKSRVMTSIDICCIHTPRRTLLSYFLINRLKKLLGHRNTNLRKNKTKKKKGKASLKPQILSKSSASTKKPSEPYEIGILLTPASTCFGPKSGMITFMTYLCSRASLFGDEISSLFSLHRSCSSLVKTETNPLTLLFALSFFRAFCIRITFPTWWKFRVKNKDQSTTV